MKYFISFISWTLVIKKICEKCRINSALRKSISMQNNDKSVSKENIVLCFVKVLCACVCLCMSLERFKMLI